MLTTYSTGLKVHDLLNTILDLCGALDLYGFHYYTYLAKDSLSPSSPSPPDDCLPLSVLLREPTVDGTSKVEVYQ